MRAWGCSLPSPTYGLSLVGAVKTAPLCRSRPLIRQPLLNAAGLESPRDNQQSIVRKRLRSGVTWRKSMLRSARSPSCRLSRRPSSFHCLVQSFTRSANIIFTSCKSCISGNATPSVRFDRPRLNRTVKALIKLACSGALSQSIRCYLPGLKL